MSRRYGNILSKIVDEDNLNESFSYVLRGRKRKTSRAGRYLIRHREEVIQSIKENLLSGCFTIKDYREYDIVENGKEKKVRTIQSVSLIDRIALNAIMKVVEKYINKTMIANTAASIKGKGGHYLHRRLVCDIGELQGSEIWVYKCDIRHFYSNIDQDKMMDILKKMFKDKPLLDILHECVYLLDSGLSIGLRSSQSFGNLYLSYYVDHYLKDILGVKYYYRYCDDIVILGTSAHELTPIIQALKNRVKLAGLTIKGNEQLFNLKDRAIDFLGYRTFTNQHILIRKHIKKRFVKHWRRVKSKKRKVALIGAYYGMCKHASAKNLFKTTTGMSIKQFADFGLNFKAKDGKKRFSCNIIPLRDLTNREIEVLDYEKDVKTAHGDSRYLIHFTGRESGEGKFFTASEEMHQMLDKIRELDGFPFRTTIRSQSFGRNKVKYIFT